MKRSLIVSIGIAGTLAASACIGRQVTRYYIYYMPERTDSWHNRQNRELANAWSDLLGTYISEEDLDVLPYDESRFTPDSYCNIVKVCMDGRHPEELKYLRLLARQRKESRFSYDDWDYPDKEEIAAHEANLRRIREEARAYRGTRLASQYRLMQMRLSFALKDWDDCIRLWQAQPKDFSIFTEMMRNLYAGVLYRTGHKDEAFAIYSDMGDDESASWCAAKTGSVAGIEDFYRNNPNSPVLPYLIREFCNNTQETVDVLDDIAAGEMDKDIDKQEALDFIGAREINRATADSFVRLALEAAANPKVTDPAMWLNAAALVKFYYGDMKEAATLITRADDARGSVDSHLNTKFISVFIDTAMASDDDALSAVAADRIERLSLMSDTPHARRMMERLIHTVLVPRFKTSGDLHGLLAALAALEIYSPHTSDNDYYSYGSQYLYNPDYSTYYFHALNALSPAQIKEWADFVSDPGNTPWKKIINRLSPQEDFLNDIIGTAYLRKGKWNEARKYLAKVPLSFLSGQNIAPFAAVRPFADLPWTSPRDKVREGKKTALTRNAKLDFCNYMLELESKPMTADNAYRMAGAYYTASQEGKCWWLTDYSWTCCPDSATSRSCDFADKARKLLNQSKTLKGNVSPEMIMFAQAYTAPGDLYEYDWNTSRWIYRRDTPAFGAYTALSRIMRNTDVWPAVIRRCDVLKQFMRDNPR